MKARGHMLLPILALIAFWHNPPGSGICCLLYIVLTILVSQLRQETRMGIKDVIEALADRAKTVAFRYVGLCDGRNCDWRDEPYQFWYGDYFFYRHIRCRIALLTLFLTMIASAILGMGYLPIPAYIITATMAAPALATFDVRY